MKSSDRALSRMCKEAMKAGSSLHPMLGTLSSSADAKEWRRAEKHHLVGKWCLPGTLESSKMHNNKVSFCKSLVSHFCFRKGEA